MDFPIINISNLEKFDLLKLKQFLEFKIDEINRKISRADLVILNEKLEPEVLIEFKFCYIFNLDESKIENDIWTKKHKLRDDYIKHKNNPIEKYFVLICLNSLSCPDKKYKPLVAYYSKLESFYKKHKNNYYNKGKENIKNLLEKIKLIELIDNSFSPFGRELNDHLGVKNELYYFVFKPK